MLVLLQSISDGERDEEHPNLIRVNALKAYEIALKKYHGWMLQKLFTVSVHISMEEKAFPKAHLLREGMCFRDKGLETWEAVDLFELGPSLCIPASPRVQPPCLRLFPCASTWAL